MGKAFDRGRRRFLTEFFRDKVVRPLVDAGDEVREAAWRGRLEAAYESELRAFGPDVLVDTAQRSGIAAEAVDYPRVAKTLANEMASQDYGCQ